MNQERARERPAGRIDEDAGYLEEVGRNHQVNTIPCVVRDIGEWTRIIRETREPRREGDRVAVASELRERVASK